MKPLQLGQLFALPLQSAVRAQNLALQETLSFIEQFGLEEGSAKIFKFKAERLVEEKKADPKTGISETQHKVQPFEVSIPLLALISPPSMQLQEMNVEFGVEVVDPKIEVLKSSVIPSKVLGHSLASSGSILTPLNQSNTTTMKVNMKIVREIPEGLARLGDVLADTLGGKTLPGGRDFPSKVQLSVEKIKSINKATADNLKANGIITVADLLSATEAPESIKKLSKTLGLSETIIGELREYAKRFLEEEGERIK